MCSKRNYDFYKKHNICVQCGQEDAEKNHVLCFRCMIKNRENTINYQKKHKEELKEKNRIKSKLRYYRLKEQGICPSCGRRKTKNNKTMCEYCRIKINTQRRKKYLLDVYATRNITEIRV